VINLYLLFIIRIAEGISRFSASILKVIEQSDKQQLYQSYNT